MKDKFLRYEKVRLSGKYNMLTESEQARKEAQLSREDYLYIIMNYSDLKIKVMEEI